MATFQNWPHEFLHLSESNRRIMLCISDYYCTKTVRCGSFEENYDCFWAAWRYFSIAWRFKEVLRTNKCLTPQHMHGDRI